MIYNNPLFFEANRVFRVYTGGKLLGEFAGGEKVDNFYPEEWIASEVKANNLNSAGPKEGISRIEGTDIYLDDLIKEYPKEILGDKKEIGILVKYLDSAIKLPVQAHPDKAFSQKHFSSDHGKEESWIVLATRPGGCIYFGFKEGVTEEIFSDAIEKSKQDKTVMESLLERYDVEVGDVVLVPAKCVHAIGAGCLILEIQEPTDFTIQPEYFCGDYQLSDQEMYIGLDKQTALECFDYAPVKNVKRKPVVKKQTDDILIEELIGDDSKNFAIDRITLKGGEYLLSVPASVCMVTEGNGTIFGDGYQREVKKGDYFLLPAAAKDKFTLKGNVTLVESWSK